MKRNIFFFAPWLSMFLCCTKVAPPSAIGPVPSAAQLRWHEMETNAFVHFTINTFTDKEWGYGDESPALFNPDSTDVVQWIATFRDAGFKGVILTTKHHDGFCLWPSQYTEHDIANSPYRNGKGDLVREVSQACDRYGLKFGIYMSPWDRNTSDYGAPSYVAYYRNQLTELFTNYGPVFEMWFDGANGGDGYYGGAREMRRIDGATYYDWPATLDIVRKFEPNVIFFSDAGPGVRWVGNEKGIAGETNWNTITPDTLYAGKAGIETLLSTGAENGTHWIPAEVDVSIRPGWFYHESENAKVKTPQELFEIYLSSVGRGSTLLLNVPPDTHGRLHRNDVESLLKWKKLVDEAFRSDHARDSKVSVSSFRGGSDLFAGDKLIDGKNETYWCTDDDVHTATVELKLKAEQTLHFILLQEYIQSGQRIRQFKVEAWQDGWREVASATTIGYKRILRLQDVKTDRVKVTFISSKGCPVISTIGLF